MIKDVVKFAVTFPDQDKTSLHVDKEGVHRGGEHPQRVGGAGESSRSSNGRNRGLFFSFFIFFLLYSKEISWACLIKSFSSFLGMFLLFLLCGSLISLQRRPPQGFETCNGTNESCRLLLSLILIATLLAACKPTETFRFSPLLSWRTESGKYLLEEMGAIVLSDECFCSS